MKRCPRCDRTYPDTETFCDVDGSALVQAGPAFTESQGSGEGQQIECPVCGGKAQPGELICNFCGARLGTEPAAEQYTPPPPPPTSSRTATVRPQGSPSMRMTGRIPDQDRDEGRSILGIAAYVIAAIVALAGGAWLAIHLSNQPAEVPPIAKASPSAIPSVAAAVPIGPQVDLVSRMPVQVTGESADAPERNQDAAKKFFEDHKNTLLDSYEHALSGDSTMHNAMLVRVGVLPNGSVDTASVRTSTNPNPAFDAEVVKDVSAWTYPPFSGSEVEIDYPIVFTNDPSTRDALESQFSTKVAAMSPTELPEYASSTPAPSPGAPGAPPEAVSSPPAPSVETPVAVAPAPEPVPPRKHHRVASAPKPSELTLQQQVLAALSSNPRTRRVNCYTSGGAVTIFGKVFDADAKQYAENVVRRVPGVTGVNNSLTTDTSDWAARQAAIASQLYAAGLTGVTVKVIGSDAYLNGTVKTEAQKQQAVAITEGASPVHVRGNIINVVPGNMFGF